MEVVPGLVEFECRSPPGTARGGVPRLAPPVAAALRDAGPFTAEVLRDFEHKDGWYDKVLKMWGPLVGDLPASRVRCPRLVVNRSGARPRLSNCAVRLVGGAGGLWGIRTEVVGGQALSLFTGLPPVVCKSIAKASEVRIPSPATKKVGGTRRTRR